MGLYKDYIVTHSLPEALSVIELGLADYVLAPNILGLHEIQKNGYQNIEIKGPSVIPSIYAMAVKKGDTELLNILNSGIAELRRNGTLTQLLGKWKVYHDPEMRYQQLAKTVGIILIIAVVLFVLISIWVWSLRMQIKKKTESLIHKNQELEASEEKFRMITENSSDVIWHLDDKFNLTYISPADERIRGYKKEEVLGQSLFSILKPEGIQLLMEANKKRMTDLSNGIRYAPAIYELEERCKDGSWIWVEATADALYDKHGHVTGYHGVSRDISKRKHAELMLQEREHQLRDLNATKDKLFSIIAHDLRSPFNAILGFSELLRENSQELADGERKEYVEFIHVSASSALNLLDNLLNWARSQSGRTQFTPEAVQLRSVIHDIISMTSSQAKIKNIAIHSRLIDDIEVHADVNMLKTILRNLVSNAIKYTNENGEIAIAAERKEAYIEVSVSDEGVGMSEETLNLLFTMDTNITTMGTANEKGSGLGLVLCKDFVNNHGGQIWASSELGKGSTFHFTLPS